MINIPLRLKLPQFLPEELIVEVISWLPVKDLMRFRCVCKFWNTLILSDAAFIKLHLRRSASQNPHLLLENRNCKVPVPFPISRLVENSLTTLPDDPRYALENDLLICHSMVVGSCNGLICLHGHSTRSREHWLCFWNPATRLITEKLGSFHPKGDIVNTSFGYDNSTDTFKVVVLDWNYYTKEKRLTRVSTLGCNLWRDVQNLPGDIFIHCWDEKRGVNLRSTLNWLAFDNPTKQPVILSFDLGTEAFTQFSLPPGFDDDEFPFVGVLMDSLCLTLGWTRTHWKRTHYVIWQMKEFGVEKSWTQLLKINFQDPFYNDVSIRYPLFPLCFYNGDTLILAFNVHNTVLHNTIDNRAERIRMPDVLWFYAIGYVESLFSPYGSN